MKNIQLFDFNLQYPLHVDGETLQNRAEYAEFLIRKGYAFDPFATNATEDPVEKMFDAIEDSAKKTFSRGRRTRGIRSEVQNSTSAIEHTEGEA